MNPQFWWYLARASGIVAWLLLTAAVLWGIVLATDLFPATRRPAWLLDLHRWLGGLTIGFVVVHMGALMADSYIEFSVADLVIPFAGDYKTEAVAWGIIAMWGLVIVEMTSLAMKRLPKAVWRGVHRTSALTFWLSSLHGTYAGTDASRPLYAATSAFAVIVVMAALAYRVVNRTPPRGARATTAQPRGAGGVRVKGRGARPDQGTHTTSL